MFKLCNAGLVVIGNTALIELVCRWFLDKCDDGEDDYDDDNDPDYDIDALHICEVNISAEYNNKQTDRRQTKKTQRRKPFGVPDAVRFDNLIEHFPESIPTYRRCRLCSTAIKNKRSNMQCGTCRVPLCAVPCFKEFHKQE